MVLSSVHVAQSGRAEMTAQPRNPALIVNHATRWQYGLVRDGRLVHCLGYTARRTKRALFAALQAHRAVTIQLFDGLPDDAELTYQAGAYRSPNGLALAFTGQTERDAARNGSN